MEMKTTKPPKIQVESKKDILYLKQEMRKFGESVIDDFKNNEARKDYTKEQLNNWIEQVFEMASSSIEINGIPYDNAFSHQIEYEPLDENLRSTAEELYYKVQDMLVELSAKRKDVPKQLNFINTQTLNVISQTTEVAQIDYDDDLQDQSMVRVEDIQIDGYDEICKQHLGLVKSLPETLKKAQDIENLLNHLDIPILDQASAAKIDVKTKQRRRSSLSRALLSTDTNKPQDPKKAAESLLLRLNMESRRKV